MRRIVLAAGALVLAAVVAVVVWYGVVVRTGSGAVGPNVLLDGRTVGLYSAAELAEAVSQRAAAILEAPVEVRFEGGLITRTAEELGVVVDEEATADLAMEAGRSGDVIADFLSWARGPWRPRTISTVWDLPAEAVAAALAAHPAAVVSVPVEPRVELDEAAGFVAVPGVAGSVLDVEQATELVTAAFQPGLAITVDAPVLPVAPEDSDDQAVELARRLEGLTDRGLTVRLLGRVGRLSAPTLRQAVDLAGPVSDPEVSFDRDALEAALFALFADVTRPGADPVFEVDGDGVPVVVEAGTAPQGCCGAETGSLLVEALEGDASGILDIPAADVDDTDLVRWASGEDIVEVVGEFTTNHACCENRVSNIHRIADIIRGQYLLPGESFSVNGFVGERTTEKGFVPAGVIERGRFTESVGGGISQFATTFFNAAFFAGLDLDEYQSHSIYIDRYPYGREATLSYPKPDLRVTNTTDYPILVWPTYTDTSITVTLYSTAHIVVEETGQETRPFNRCTDVETFRERTYPDGRVVEDSVVARYRPGEGLDCNGNPTPQP